MKKILPVLVCTLFATALFAQDSTRKKETINLANRANDHLLIQLGYTGWGGAPDSVSNLKKGISKSINVYLMWDFPFKTNPKLSMAFGPGISTDHITFSKAYIGIKDLTSTMRFSDKSDTDHFKKTKIATAYLEAPIEFRYSADPYNSDKSFKFAIGVKVGTLLNAHTRSTKYENRNGNMLNDYVQKESSKRFFNRNRLIGTARVGVGHFSLYGSYQFTPLFKEGLGPQVHPFSIGITLSGL